MWILENESISLIGFFFRTIPKMLNSIEISLFVLEANNYERKYTRYHKWYRKNSQRYEFIHSVLNKTKFGTRL